MSRLLGSATPWWRAAQATPRVETELVGVLRRGKTTPAAPARWEHTCARRALDLPLSSGIFDRAGLSPTYTKPFDLRAGTHQENRLAARDECRHSLVRVE